jgi:GH15 family glucan-1,4-alpha-glucosidase
LPASDQRVISTIEAIEQRLLVNGLVMRYDTNTSEDGVAGHEATFLLCSFWLVDCLMLLGRHSDAQNLFDRLLSLRNDLGLLAEEYDPVSHRLLGNFPQAFSHLGLVNSALNLSAIEPSSQRTDEKPNLTKLVA